MTHRLISLLMLLLLSLAPQAIAEEIGMASFYGRNCTGRMANGQRHHRDSMICAHKKHPFGTRLKVTNLKNGKWVVVKVTDRGPFGRGRIVDLSWGAAEKLGMIAAGVAKVKVEVVNGKLDSEIDSHPNDSTDLIIDYGQRQGYELPFAPGHEHDGDSIPRPLRR